MKLLKHLPTLLYPEICPICLKVIEADKTICSDCNKLFLHPGKNKGICKICSYPSDICSCGKHLYYSRLSSPFIFKGDVRRSLHKMKFRNRLDIVKPFARLTSQSIKERELDATTDFITFIPMTDKSFRKRGYNQSQLLAEEIAEQLKIPCLPVLIKLRETPTQHSLNLYRRRGNLLGAFEVLPEFAKEIKGKRILIIDDIVTGGATMNEAAKTLLIFGAEEIYCSSVAFSSIQKKKKRKK